MEQKTYEYFDPGILDNHYRPNALITLQGLSQAMIENAARKDQACNRFKRSELRPALQNDYVCGCSRVDALRLSYYDSEHVQTSPEVGPKNF